jgi:L-lysine 6-transaminase
MNKLYPLLSKHILADKHAIVVDLQRSHGSWLVDEDGKERLDCFSQYASQPLGWNHSKVRECSGRLFNVCMHNVANSDIYTREYAQFVETFASITPDFKYHFFIAGGALGVENALKAAFDWKAKKMGLNEDILRNKGAHGMTPSCLNVIHLKDAFHGRTGYTMSLTNTDPKKTDLFPKFDWTRITNPKIGSQWPDNQNIALKEAEFVLKDKDVAAFIMEPIQGEGGDNHFHESFAQEIRKLCDKYEAMLIFDEVQCGVGLTGKMWAYEHYNVKPDMICFGKKIQVCGFSSNERIDEVKDNVFKVPSRINSTWGGNLVDMVRSTIYLEIIKEDNLVEQARLVGDYFLNKLNQVGLLNLRGKGLMIAFDFETTDKRDEFLDRLSERMLAIKCGSRSIRLRPHLTFGLNEADLATDFIRRAL